jgi:hypothetical protein
VPAAAGWLVLAVLGWTATLQLIDAPPAVAYQHLRFAPRGPVTVVALAVIAVQALAVVMFGRPHLAAIVGWCRENLGPGARMMAFLLVLVPAAVPSREAAAYATELALSFGLQMLAFITLVAAVRSAPESMWRRAGGIIDFVLGPRDAIGPRRVDAWVICVASGVVLIAAALAWFVYEAHPHVPDEVVYLLHARYLAEGMLTMPLPPVPAGFNLDLMYYEPARWFSPVPPGWPMVLAIGAWLGAPWLVNPVLGGLAIVLTYLLLGRITGGREARLTTLLLATSPWFLFMSMNFMTHTSTLVLALAAALGVAIARQNGSTLASFAGGLAVGAAAMVRPLEGLVTALLLGLWSLGARGRRFRLAPSAALVAGSMVTGLLDRPYNALLTGSPGEFPIMAYINKYYAPGSNDLGFGPNRGLGWGGLDPFPGHGPVDVIVNAALNTSTGNAELLGWPLGGVAVVSLVFILGAGRVRRSDWWFAAAIATVAGAHSLYWFSGGPDFGPRYWYLIIVPCCALVARGLSLLDDTRSAEARANVPARTIGLVLMVMSLVVYVPWRATAKYHHYRGMRADVRTLARQHRFDRSLVLVRGAQHPDYASAAVYNPIDLRADATVYAWDASTEIRAALLKAYSDRPVWIIDGPSITGGAFRVVAGPLTPQAALETTIPPRSIGGPLIDPVFPPLRQRNP